MKNKKEKKIKKEKKNKKDNFKPPFVPYNKTMKKEDRTTEVIYYD